MQPGSAVGPVRAGGGPAQAHRLRRLLDRQAGEVAGRARTESSDVGSLSGSTSAVIENWEAAR